MRFNQYMAVRKKIYKPQKSVAYRIGRKLKPVLLNVNISSSYCKMLCLQVNKKSALPSEGFLPTSTLTITIPLFTLCLNFKGEASPELNDRKVGFILGVKYNLPISSCYRVHLKNSSFFLR